MKKLFALLTICLLFACGDKSDKSKQEKEKEKELTICDCTEFLIDYYMLGSTEWEVKYFREKYVQYDENGEEFVPCFSSIVEPIGDKLADDDDYSAKWFKESLNKCEGAETIYMEVVKRYCGHELEGLEYDNCVEEGYDYYESEIKAN